MIFILTRARGPRRWRLLGWWTLFTMLATAWWWLPLLLLGRYSVPFLDYIENATITTVPTDLARTLVGESDWVAYFAGIDFQAGQQLVSTPFLMLDAAVVVALGLVGIALRDNPHRRFLTLGLLTGLVLVGFGYAGDLSGFFAADRAEALDGVLAPLRNLHKFDVVLRIPLVLGLAHAMAVLPKLLRSPGVARRQPRRGPRGARDGGARPGRAGAAVGTGPDRAAPGRRRGARRTGTASRDYLADHDDGTVALEVPRLGVRRLHLGQHPRRRAAGAGREPVGGPQRDPAGPARQRRVPRRGHPHHRVGHAEPDARVLPGRQRRRAGWWSATTSTGSRPAPRTRRTSAAC